jgi:hypothetical protein
MILCWHWVCFELWLLIASVGRRRSGSADRPGIANDAIQRFIPDCVSQKICSHLSPHPDDRYLFNEIIELMETNNLRIAEKGDSKVISALVSSWA